MASITFDTHRFIRKLRDAGVSEPQAEAFADAFREAQAEAELATKQDVENLRYEMREFRTELLGELKLMRWMLGILLAGVLSILIRVFF